MKSFYVSMLALIFSVGSLFVTGTAYSVEAKGWRIVFTQSIENNTQIGVSEIEFLHDDDDDSQTPRVDATQADLGAAECGWTRQVPNLTGTTSLVPVGCDSVSTDQLRESTTVPDGTPRTRLGKLLFDDNFASEYKTRRVINETNGSWTIQYVFYVGDSAPGRTLKDVDAYSITVSNEYLGPSPNGLAPSAWRVEFLDSNSGRWVRVQDGDVFEANFNNGVDVDSEGREEGDTGYTTSVGKKLTYILP